MFKLLGTLLSVSPPGGPAPRPPGFSSSLVRSLRSPLVDSRRSLLVEPLRGCVMHSGISFGVFSSFSLVHDGSSDREARAFGPGGLRPRTQLVQAVCKGVGNCTPSRTHHWGRRPQTPGLFGALCASVADFVRSSGVLREVRSGSRVAISRDFALVIRRALRAHGGIRPRALARARARFLGQKWPKTGHFWPNYRLRPRTCVRARIARARSRPTPSYLYI